MSRCRRRWFRQRSPTRHAYSSGRRCEMSEHLLAHDRRKACRNAVGPAHSCTGGADLVGEHSPWQDFISVARIKSKFAKLLMQRQFRRCDDVEAMGDRPVDRPLITAVRSGPEVPISEIRRVRLRRTAASHRSHRRDHRAASGSGARHRRNRSSTRGCSLMSRA